MSGSSSVFLNNLDDFIAPSQSCVNPFVSAKLDKAIPPKPSRKHGRVTIEEENDLEDFSGGGMEADLIKSKVTDTRRVATVSLNDCLACSGCVTSAEAVLVQEQSVDKFVQMISGPLANTSIIVQISPNSTASIAEFLGMSPKDLFLRMAAVLKSLGVRYVLDASAGADVAMIEAREEFITRFKGGRSKAWEKPRTSTAESSTSVALYDGADREIVEEGSLPSISSALPVFTSHCPGWVCYAEKTAPQALPYMSTVKSAQQIVGSVIKSMLSASKEDDMDDESAFINALSSLSLDTSSAPPASVFVVSVQPCFDKKLEASRKDFFHAAQAVAEVDLVLSTTELWQLLEGEAYKWAQTASDAPGARPMDEDLSLDFDCEDGLKVKRCKPHNEPPTSQEVQLMDLDSPPSPPEDSSRRRQMSVHETFQHVFSYLDSLNPDAPEGVDEIEGLFRSFSSSASTTLVAAERNSASGGYVEYLFRYAAKVVYGVDIWDKPLVYKEGRNADMSEVDLAAMMPDRPTPPRLRFARAYGFRNVQTVMLKMKRGQCEFDLVEVMACPSGCTNGGGQLKSLSSLLPQTGDLPAHSPRTETPAQSKSRIKDVDDLFHATLQFRQPEDSPLVKYLYDARRLASPLSDKARQLLHTRYHSVPKLETIAPLAVKW